jgi:hypothetical protein
MLAVLVLYLVPKYAAYVAWCYLGLRKFRPRGGEEQNQAFLYGFYRFLIGFGFGALVFAAAAILGLGNGNSNTDSIFSYIGIYFPVRWIEWTIMSVLIIPESRSFLQWVVGLHQSDRLWRLGGIGLSFLADVALVFISDGFRVGRILC